MGQLDLAQFTALSAEAAAHASMTSPCIVPSAVIDAAVADAAVRNPEDLDPGLLDLVERASTLSIVRAIRALGFFRHAGDHADLDSIERLANVATRFRRLLVGWLGALSDDGWLVPVAPNQWITPGGLPDEEPRWAELELAAGAHGALIEYLQQCSVNLVPLLREDRDPISLLFPGANTDIAEQLYKLNPLSSYLNAIAAAGVSELVRQHEGALRVLELGAGTGGTTDGLLGRFDPGRTGYWFTDVSSFLIARARKRYASQDWIRYATLDLNRDVIVQGFEPASVHLAVAANVLHYADDARAGLAQVRRLLVPGGYLVAIEATHQARWQLISLAFLDGLSVSDERSAAAMPLLAPDRWKALLTESGYELVSIQPDPAGSLAWIGAHVLVARAPQTMAVERPRFGDGAIDAAAWARTVEEAPTASHSIPPSTDLERAIASVFETILNRPAVSVEENFFDLGADSLTAAHACEALQQTIHKRLDVVDLLTHPNIRALAAHLSTSDVDSTANLAGDRARKRLALMDARRRRSREGNQE